MWRIGKMPVGSEIEKLQGFLPCFAVSCAPQIGCRIWVSSGSELITRQTRSVYETAGAVGGVLTGGLLVEYYYWANHDL